MDPISIIVTALVAGITGGLTQTTSQAVKDAYESLKNSIVKNLENPSKGELLIKKIEAQPAEKPIELLNELQQSNIKSNREILELALNILNLTNTQSSEINKYKIDIRDSKGIINGDGNTVEQTFND